MISLFLKSMVIQNFKNSPKNQKLIVYFETGQIRLILLGIFGTFDHGKRSD